MVTLFNEEIDKYVVDLFELPGTAYNRELRVSLKSAHTVSIRFQPAPPADFIDEVTPNFTVLYLSSGRYDEIYHLLQTESPVFLTAYEFPIGGNVFLRFAGISSDPEATGEGFRDANTMP
jgi:hypothetical protein